MSQMPPFPPDPADPGYEVPSGPTDDERMWAAISHAGSFVAAWFALGIIAPIIVIIFKGTQPGFVRNHAYESLNFQLNALAWVIISLILVFALIGIAMLIVIGIFYLIVVIIATLAATRGEEYRYPAIIRVFNP